MSLTFFPQTSQSGEGESSYGDPIPVLDHFTLYEECQAIGLATDWWFPKANSVTMIAGEESSEAYLLLTKKHIDGCDAEDNNGVELLPISRAIYNHRIALQDSARISLGGDAMNIDGWVFHSARAIDASSDPGDLDAVYLVKLVDKRWLFAQQAGIATISGALLQVESIGFNVVNLTSSDEGMDYDPGLVDSFPFIGETVGATTSYSWRTILESLWLDEGFLSNSGATMGFQNDLLPDGGVYPEQNPIDVLPENDTTWSFFCKVLHASGNEIYPLLDGKFRILPIDDHFGEPPTLDNTDFYPSLIETGHLDASDRLLPEYVIFHHRNRDRNEEATSAEINSYTQTDGRPYAVTSIRGFVPLGTPLITLDELENSGCTQLHGTFPVSEGIPGVIEGITCPFMSIVRPGFDSGLTYSTHVDLYSIDVLTRLLKSRMDNTVDSTYGRFINLAPSPEFEKVSWFFNSGGPCTRFESLPSTIGVDEVPYRGTGGSGRDRKVAADEDDQTPAELIDKIEDTTISVYDPMLHQLCWGEIVQHGVAPDRDNKVRLYTTIGASPAGPPGSPGMDGSNGADGAPGPTYTDGCGIIVAGTVISFDRADVMGLGLKVDPVDISGCTISFDPDPVVACGLEAAADNGANLEVKIKINPDALWTAGSGIVSATGNTANKVGPCKIKIQPSDLCGDGLDVQPGNQADANGPVKIKVKPNVTVNNLTGASLARVGDDLVLTLNITPVQVYGTTGVATTIVATIGGTECDG